MAKETNRLNALKVSKLNHAGYHHDGAGLYLQITRQNNKSWVFRYTRSGKTREMGLGPLRSISLAEARQKRDALKKVLLDGLDPLFEKEKKEQLELISKSKKVSFEFCALSYIESHRPTWKNEKHCMQWHNTLKTYAFPIIGNLPVDQIETSLVIKIIEPIWMNKTETASRVRNRIELVLSWAAIRGYRSGENPARWRGHLDQLLPKRSQVQKVKHMAALPYPLISNFIVDLKSHACVSAMALEFIILTATRTSETLGAKWSEFDLENNVWTIPLERMKSKKEHRVPLSNRALDILKLLKKSSLNPLVFTNDSNKKQLSGNAILALLNRMNYDVTTHGFRSTFRDWVSEETGYSREVAEASLAHSLRNKVEAAYRRGDFFQKRKALMDEWGKYCYQHQNSIIRIG